MKSFFMHKMTLLPFCFFFFTLNSYVFSHVEELESINVVEDENDQALVDFLPTSTKLKASDLVKKRQTSLGDTLSQEVGVQTTQFGPNVSRPVVRGLDGDRIRVLQNGLGTMDASSQSLDHAIPVDSLTIDQIEINRGPMTLLYGPSAVGGVINLVTNRIHYQYEEGFFSKFETRGETVNNGISSSVHFNYGKNKWMHHLDASTRNLGNLKIPSYAKSSSRATSQGVIKNSDNQQDNLAFATSKIFDQGYIGVSFNHFNSDYGSVTEEDVTIEMTQNRFELHSEWRPQSSILRKIKFKSAQTDYMHREFEGDVSGTIFKNNGNESRLELITQTKQWNGVTGLHTQMFKFESYGEEAFLPVSKNRHLSAFTFLQYSKNSHAIRFGGRLEEQQVNKLGDSKELKTFTSHGLSVGHCYDFSKTHKLESSLSYTERPPSFQELFSNGTHIATGTEEEGNSKLKKEEAMTLDIFYESTNIKNSFKAGVFAQYFSDYISLNATGEVGDEFDIYRYEQTDALFYGVELESKFLAYSFKKRDLFLRSQFDLLRARDVLRDDFLPRVSPMRFTFGIELEGDRLKSDLETQVVFAQNETAPNETSTDEYILTQFGLSYQMIKESSSINIFFRVRNIFDVVARNHISFVKDVAPLAGRNFILGLQYQM